MKKLSVLRLISAVVIVSLTLFMCIPGAAADNLAPARTFPPLPTLPGSAGAAPSAAEPTATVKPTATPVPTAEPTEQPIKLETLSTGRSAGSDVNIPFILVYVLIFTVPLFITLRNMAKLKKLGQKKHRSKKE